MQEIFLQKELNSAGVYSMKTWVKGLPKEVVVDDSMPMKEETDGESFWFARSGPDGSLWGPIAEKVWAKVNNNYSNLQGGYPVEGLYFLTGVPGYAIMSHEHNSVDQIYKTIKDLAVNGGYATLGTKRYDFSRIGLTSHRVYSIHDAYKLQNGDCLVHMRDPFGTDQFKGIYNRDENDEDSEWTSEVAEELRKLGAPERALGKQGNGEIFILCS